MDWLEGTLTGTPYISWEKHGFSPWVHVGFLWNQSNETRGHLSKLSVSSWGNSYLSPEAQLHMKTRWRMMDHHGRIVLVLALFLDQKTTSTYICIYMYCWCMDGWTMLDSKHQVLSILAKRAWSSCYQLKLVGDCHVPNLKPPDN